MSPEDAALAVRYGVDAVWVSNHGGRQLDHGEGTSDARFLESIDVVGDAAEVVVDSGILRGTTVGVQQEACYLVRQMPCSGRWFGQAGPKYGASALVGSRLLVCPSSSTKE